MKKLLILTLFSLLFFGGIIKSYAQEDSAKVAEEPKDTISIDNADPKFYEEEAPKETSNTKTYAIIGGIIVIGGAVFYFMKRKKK